MLMTAPSCGKNDQLNIFLLALTPPFVVLSDQISHSLTFRTSRMTQSVPSHLPEQQLIHNDSLFRWFNIVVHQNYFHPHT